MKDNLKIGAAYIRVSTDGQLDYSPESQLDEIKKFASNNGILLDSQYVFIEQDGVSGKKAGNRVAFQQMIAAAKTKPKPFDVILVWKFSRFARNQDESTFYKSTLRKKYGIDVMSVSEPIMEGMYGRLIEMIIEWQDEFYSYNLSGEVHRGMKKRAELGGYNGKMPFGYTKERDNNPVIFEEEASIVRHIFDMYINGYDKPYICRYLNERNIKTKNGKKFVSDTIQYILQNPFYIGKIRWNVHNNSASSIRDESEWIITQGSHAPIISEETFKMAQEKTMRNTAIRNAYSKPVSRTKHYLSGLLKCPICHKTLTYHHRSGRSDYFQCRGYKNGLHGESQSVTSKAVTAALINSLEQILENHTAKYEVIPRTDSCATEKGIILRELDKLKSREDRIKNAYLSGVDSLEEYKENKKTVSQYRKELERRLKALVSEDLETDMDHTFYNSVQSVLDIMQSDTCDYTQKGAALRNILKYIEHYKEDDTYVFHYCIMQP